MFAISSVSGSALIHLFEGQASTVYHAPLVPLDSATLSIQCPVLSGSFLELRTLSWLVTLEAGQG